MRTHEGLKFERFFSIVQEEAMSKGFVFFLDCGENNEFEDEDIQCQNLCGWLIPENLSQKFEEAFLSDNIADEWSDFLAWAIWRKENNNIRIEFER